MLQAFPRVLGIECSGFGALGRLSGLRVLGVRVRDVGLQAVGLEGLRISGYIALMLEALSKKRGLELKGFRLWGLGFRA